jgi:hypothetical protein
VFQQLALVILALAEVGQISELIGARFSCWIWKLTPTLCGPGLISDKWRIIVFRKSHLFGSDSSGALSEYKSLTWSWIFNKDESMYIIVSMNLLHNVYICQLLLWCVLAPVLGHFLGVFKFFSLCNLCVNLFGTMYNIKVESNLLSHKLQMSLQWYLKIHDSVSIRNSPACSSLAPKLQEPLSLNFIVSCMWAKYRRLNNVRVTSYTSDYQPTKIPVNRGLLKTPQPSSIWISETGSHVII